MFTTSDGVSPTVTSWTGIVLTISSLLFAASASLAQEQPAAPDAKAFSYKVRQGESLIGLARRHKVSVQAIREANGLNGASTLRRGALLTIPAAGATAALAKTPRAEKNEPFLNLWVGAKPVKPSRKPKAPVVSNGPLRIKTATPAPAFPSAPAASAGSVQADAASLPPAGATMTPPAEAPSAALSPALTLQKPAAAPRTAAPKPPVKRGVANSRGRAAATRKSPVSYAPNGVAAPSLSPEEAAPKVAAAAPAVTPVAASLPAEATPEAQAASAAPKDLDDMPLSSVLSKNTAGEGKTGRSTGNLVADVLTKLGFVILLGLGAAAAWKKFQGQSFSRPAKPQQTAEVASVLPLGPQRSVHLLKIGNQTLVVASTPQNISLLATLDDSQAAGTTEAANQIEPDFQALIGQLVQSGTIAPQETVTPMAVETVEETGGRLYTGLTGSLFQAAKPVAESR